MGKDAQEGQPEPEPEEEDDDEDTELRTIREISDYVADHMSSKSIAALCKLLKRHADLKGTQESYGLGEPAEDDEKLPLPFGKVLGSPPPKGELLG